MTDQLAEQVFDLSRVGIGIEFASGANHRAQSLFFSCLEVGNCGRVLSDQLLAQIEQIVRAHAGDPQGFHAFFRSPWMIQ